MICRIGLRTSCADKNKIEVTKIRKVVADFVMLGSGIVHRATALRCVYFHAGCRIDSVYSQFKEHPMRSIARPLVLVAIFCLLSLIWMAHTDSDIVVAQTGKPIVMTRNFGPEERIAITIPLAEQ